MKRLTEEERIEKFLDYIQYRWEFIFRNADFQKAVKEYREAKEKGEDFSKHLESFLNNWGYLFSLDSEGNPHRKFKLSDLNLHLTPKGIKKLRKNHGKGPEYIYTVVHRFDSLLHFLKIENFPTKDSECKKLTVTIDLQAPSWLINASLETLINASQAALEIPDKKISFDILDNYLKIIDLTENGFNDKEIARRVFLKDIDDQNQDIEDALESAVKKVRRYRTRARELIKKGQIM